MQIAPFRSMAIGNVDTALLVLLVTMAINFSPTKSQTLQWNRVQPASAARPPPRRYSALAWSTTALYLFGGEAINGTVLGLDCRLLIIIINISADIYSLAGDTWKFSLFSNEWEQLAFVERPEARYGFVAGVLGRHWYITHGEQFLCWSSCFLVYKPVAACGLF